MQSEIPEDVMKAAKKCAGEWNLIDAIARAILAERDRCEAALSVAETVKPVLWANPEHMPKGNYLDAACPCQPNKGGNFTLPLYAAPPALSTQVQDVAAGVMAAIAEERKRQIAKGYDASHDDAHDTYEIIDASWGAAARINIARSFRDQHNISGYKAALIKAAAQIVAEIERLDRAAAPARQEAKTGWAFAEGDLVRKKSGSWWEGRVVGTYTTEQTPRGYSVQLDKPFGPVQIYPESALESALQSEDR